MASKLFINEQNFTDELAGFVVECPECQQKANLDVNYQFKVEGCRIFINIACPHCGEEKDVYYEV